MLKNCGFIVGTGHTVIKSLVTKFSLRAFAEEVQEGETEGETEGDGTSHSSRTVNYEDLISKAREEEKKKQYKTIERLKGQVDTLTQQHNNDLLSYAQLDKDFKELQLSIKDGGQSPDVKALQEKVTSLEKEKKDLEAEVAGLKNQQTSTVNEAEIEQRIREEYEVKLYKTEKLSEHREDILVPELVFGSTKEEIDASIQKALERSAEIRKSLGVTDDGKKPQKRTPKSPTNPSVSSIQDKEISIERLASLDVRSPEYAELRKQLGLH